MFNFDRTEIQRMVVAAVGALLLSTAAISAAIGPAFAVESGPVLSAHATAKVQARG
jgi:hypothetical protein